jgi:hypothetical protein
MPRYELYGLVVESEVALPARPDRSERAADLTIGLGAPRSVGNDVPAGDLVAHARWGDKGYAAARASDGILVRFFGTSEVELSLDLARMTVFMAPSAPAGLASTLLCGTVLALLLSLRGQCVLHASAATIHGTTLAFVGDTGSGKSTLAALACARGAALLTDDVLCLDLATSPPRCRRGPLEIRLRDNAASLIERVMDEPARRTADERWSVQPALEVEGEPELSALVFPQPTREASAATLRRLPARECLLRLVRAPRLGGLRDTGALAEQFARLAEAARRVPSYAATVPWGPPFDEAIIDRLVTLLGAP